MKNINDFFDNLGALSIMAFVGCTLWMIWDYRNPVAYQASATVLVIFLLCLVITIANDDEKK